MTPLDSGVWRGPRPVTVKDVYALKEAGIKACLSLQSGWYEALRDEVYEEDEMLESRGIRSFHLPLSDWRPPTREVLETAKMLMTDVANHPIYVHCLHGVDRTGIVCAYYRVKVHGWAIDRALGEMYTLGFHTMPYRWPLGWVWALRKIVGTP